MKTVFPRAVPYGRDALHLPVRDVGSAIPYYERTLGFRVVTRESSPVNRAVLARDGIQIGLAENGGEPEQEGCFFEVDDVEAAYFEIKGRRPAAGEIKVQQHGGGSFRAFFEIAPDGLCYLIGQPAD